MTDEIPGCWVCNCGRLLGTDPDCPACDGNEKTVPPGSANDPVNNPAHYTGHPSGIEAIQITEHMNFCLGNAVKYIWRADLKNDAIEDLKKARWYVDREIERRERLAIEAEKAKENAA